jgi:glycosyltransferase involved in cell wall biosynthesis
VIKRLRAVRAIGLAILCMADAAIAVVLCFVALLMTIPLHLLHRTKLKRIAFLVPGADIASIHRKFGTLSVYYRDNPANYFEHCYQFLFGAPNNSKLELRNDFTVYERKLPLSVLTMTYLLKLVVEISVLVDRERIAILQARDPYSCGLVMWAVSRITNTPFCVSIHADYDKAYALSGRTDAPVYWGSRKVAKMLERFVLSHAPMVLPIRDSIAENAIKNGARPDRIRVIPHGIDLTPFTASVVPNFKKMLHVSDRKIICSVGRVNKYNYAEDIVKIAKRMKEKRDDFVILVAGDGDKRQELENRCRELNLTGVVRFVGFQPREVIPSLRRIADVNLCLKGGFSLVEACAAGRPVVSYDVEWHYELVKNGKTGYLIPENDVDSAVEAICELLDNPIKARAMGENARRLAFGRHGTQKTDQVKIRAYEELLRS